MQLPIEMMTTKQVREYLDRHKPTEFTLLDVRQDWEYEEYHIPGATLIPLVELPDRLDEIPHDKPLVVYCAAGGRSMAAATLLEGQGHTDIINMVGGMSAWMGHTAFGPMRLGMVVFTGTEVPEEIVFKAYAMENALQVFYVQRADMAESLERIELFMELAGFEDKHKNVLFNLYKKITGDEDRDGFEEMALAGVGDEIEGGVAIERFLEEFGEAFDDDQGILQLAVMIEAQALDYYLRCAMRADNESTRDILQLLAREEKAHLKVLGRHMDRRRV